MCFVLFEVINQRQKIILLILANFLLNEVRRRIIQRWFFILYNLIFFNFFTLNIWKQQNTFLIQFAARLVVVTWVVQFRFIVNYVNYFRYWTKVNREVEFLYWSMSRKLWRMWRTMYGKEDQYLLIISIYVIYLN